jgi:hypothetical protein
MILKEILLATDEVKKMQALAYFRNAGTTAKINEKEIKTEKNSNNELYPSDFIHAMINFRKMNYYDIDPLVAKSEYDKGYRHHKDFQESFK